MSEANLLNLVSQTCSLSNAYSQEHIKQSETLDFVQSSQGQNQDYSSTSNSSKKGSGIGRKRISKELASLDINFKRNQGHWTTDEHKTYVEFLEQHHNSTMQNQQNRKNNKIFKLMSEIIGTRSPSQCRSHHQKFNPFTAAGQKRIKRNRKRTNTESQINVSTSDVQIKIPLTPDIKKMPQQQDLPFMFQHEISQQNFQNLHYFEESDQFEPQQVNVDDSFQQNRLPFNPRQSIPNLDDYFNNKPCSVQNELNNWFQ